MSTGMRKGEGARHRPPVATVGAIRDAAAYGARKQARERRLRSEREFCSGLRVVGEGATLWRVDDRAM